MAEIEGRLRIADPAGLEGPQSGAGDAPVLDRGHLARQCFGDRALETELLSAFRPQARALAREIAEDACLRPGARADLAHRLRGSALAVGAGRVARAAALVEALGRAMPPEGPERSRLAAELAQAIGALVAAVAEAAAEIDRLQE